MFKVVYSPIYNGLDGVIYEGSKRDCELIYKALIQVKAEHKIELISPPSFLSDQTRNRLVEDMADKLRDGMFGDGLELDYIFDGMGWEGLNNMDDQELLDQAEQVYMDDDELIVIAKQELEEFKLLRTEG